ncbi:hypothetical protein GWO43_11630, partial [candidate division KSB1 bacterium]|nr:hypothetical protein [candidate division KSB1 bacterium]NIR70749.1 hypothetical protein [candidate division KSB1 bacterium]NIS24607.1 hypothetical protein [candidate division KSB1 bacterium]NIT71516.1 hypothetical protein [candidate division KSB1 bacterium]NIU25207.1 hypothetical protein [candidate division KSB1 bacterium]
TGTGAIAYVEANRADVARTGWLTCEILILDNFLFNFLRCWLGLWLSLLGIAY